MIIITYMKTVYMDYAAGTPVSKRALKSMEPFWQDRFYNPSSLYPEAREVKEAIERARSMVARAIHARSEEIIFVSGGTESINLAILGTLRKAISDGVRDPEIISVRISSIVREKVWRRLFGPKWMKMVS